MFRRLLVGCFRNGRSTTVHEQGVPLRTSRGIHNGAEAATSSARGDFRPFVQAVDCSRA